MLKKLSIDNYALIDHLETEFPGDLVIITGETGAGKSILLGALSLLLGSKADAGVLKDKSRNCIVEAEFISPEGAETIIRRVLAPSGRSRAFIDDCPVTLDQLQATSSHLVDIHSQNQHLLLADRAFQMSVLDGYASLSAEIASYSVKYDAYQKHCRKLSEFEKSLAESGKEREFLEFQYDKLSKANLREGELQELEAEQQQLSNVELIKENLSQAEAIFAGDGENPLTSRLKEICSSLDKIRQFVPRAEELSQRVQSAAVELKDIRSEVESISENTSFNPSRLQEVDDRLSLLYDLMRRLDSSSVEELIAQRDRIAAMLGVGVDNEEELRRLKAENRKLHDECAAAAEAIHNKRASEAPQLSEKLQNLVRGLEMPLASFEVRVEEKESFGPDGKDDILFFFNANGAEPRELSKCASGGELSRIMLCIKSFICHYTGMPTMIFDEIDTGISGSIADKMGRMIVDMGSSMQVMAITHLPQVASKGSAHFLVYKDGGQTLSTHIRKIEGEERVNEVARMLSGAGITEESKANARVLLNEK